MPVYGIVNLATAVPARSSVMRYEAPTGEPLLGRQGFADVLAVGPWLIDMKRAPEVPRLWHEHGRWQDWGYTFHSDEDFPTLLRHFKKFNYAKVEGSDKQYIFRYFDTGIFLDFMRNAIEDDQARAFFKGIKKFTVEDKDAQETIDILPPDN